MVSGQLEFSNVVLGPIELLQGIQLTDILFCQTGSPGVETDGLFVE